MVFSSEASGSTFLLQKSHWFKNQHRYLYRSLSPPLPPNGATAHSVPGPLHYRGFAFTLRHTTLVKNPLDEWSAQRRTSTWQQKTLTTDIHARGGIRTRSPSKRAAANLRPRSRGHLYRRTDDVIHSKSVIPLYSWCYIDNKYALRSLFPHDSCTMNFDLLFVPSPTSAWT